MRLIHGCLVIAMALATSDVTAQDMLSDEVTGPEQDSSVLEFGPRPSRDPIADIQALRAADDFEGAARLAEATLAAVPDIDPVSASFLQFVRLDAMRVAGQVARLHQDMNMLLVHSPLEAHLAALRLTRDGSMLEDYKASYTAVIDGWPDYIDHISAVPLSLLLNERRDMGFERDALGLVERLWKAGYGVGADGGRIDAHYLDLAAERLRRRNLDDAKAIIAGLVMDPRSVMRLWQERRFVGVWADPALADLFVPQNLPRRAALEFIGGMGQSDRASGNLVPVALLADALLAAGMVDDAVGLTGGYFPALARGEDLTRSELDVAVLHARALIQHGQADKAFAVLQALAALDMTTNAMMATAGAEAAQLLWLIGKDSDALALADRVAALDETGIGPHDRALAVASGICALETLGRGGEARARFSVLVSSGGKAYRAVRRAALCLDDRRLLDEVAQAELADPQSAPRLLAALNRYTDLTGETPRAALIADRLAAYAAEPFMAARLEPLGRIGDWPLPRAWWAQN